MWCLNILQGRVANFGQMSQKAEPGLEQHDGSRQEFYCSFWKLSSAFSLRTTEASLLGLCAFAQPFEFKGSSMCSEEASSLALSLDRYTLLQKHWEFARKNEYIYGNRAYVSQTLLLLLLLQSRNILRKEKSHGNEMLTLKVNLCFIIVWDFWSKVEIMTCKIVKIECHYFKSKMNSDQKVSGWKIWGLIWLKSVIHHPGYTLGLTGGLLRFLHFR